MMQIVRHKRVPRVAVIVSLASMVHACTPLGSAASSAGANASSSPPAPLVTDGPLTPAQQHWVDSTLATLSLRDRVGQMVMVWVLGDYSNVGDSAYAEVIRWVERDHIGGVSMSLGTPIEVAEKVNDMQRRSRVPLLVSADLEPGLGRLESGVFTHYLLETGGGTVFPTQMAISATGRDDDVYRVAKAIAEEGRAVGIQINFAPVVDVNNNPSNPVINTRSFGENAQRVAKLATIFIRGARDGGQFATAKHFPGHGDTDVDSHVGLPIVGATQRRLDTLELVPFRAAIAAGASLVMTAHVALPAVEGDSTTPATLAPKIITGLLRDTLGFRGTAITDAMTMEGVGKGYNVEQSSVMAIQAGADILLKPTDPPRAIDAVVAAVERGEITRDRIDRAARRVLELKARSHVAFQPISSLERVRTVVGSPEHRAIARDIAEHAVTLLRDRDRLLPVPDTTSILVVQYSPETEVKAGRVFGAEFKHERGQFVKIGPNATPDMFAAIERQARDFSLVVVTAFVRRVEGEGRFAMPQPISDWIDTFSKQKKMAVVAFGNPYLIRQFPNVGTYMVTYGVSDELERAAARALRGLIPITGKVPVSLPGFFRAGDGIVR